MSGPRRARPDGYDDGDRNGEPLESEPGFDRVWIMPLVVLVLLAAICIGLIALLASGFPQDQVYVVTETSSDPCY